MIRTVSILVGAALVAVTGAAAQTTDAQRYGYNAISHADLTGAEARLIAQRAEEPNEPSVLLNLAYVYGKTGRMQEAAALYTQVLAGPDVMMLTGKRNQVSSHALAQRALDRTKGIAAR